MAPPSSRARTHTLPDDRALFFFGPIARRKSASGLPSSRRMTSADLAAPPLPTPPPGIVVTKPFLQLSTDLVSSPSQPSSSTTSAGPWTGTFLDADPDADGDSDDDTTFFDAPDASRVPATTSDTDAVPVVSPGSSSVPDLRAADTHEPEPQQQQQQQQYEPLLPPRPQSSNARDSVISILDDPFSQQFHAGSDWFSNTGPDAEPATPSLPPDSTFLSLTAPPAQPSQASQLVQPPPPSRDHGAAAAATDRKPTATAGNTSTSRYASAPVPAWPPFFEPLSLKSPTGITGQGLLRSLASPSSSMETVNIAVIGANGVGKSAFIQRALRLTKPPTQSITAIRLDVESRPFVVALIELDLEHFDVDPNQRIKWPSNISGHIVPHIDGALMVYDVMNKDSIRDLPPTISALSISGLPTILVASKCDTPEPLRQINADAMATVFPTILTNFKTSASAPANTRDCLQTIVLAAVYNRQGAEKSDHHPPPVPVTSSSSPHSATTTTRKRAVSSAALLDAPSDTNGRPLSVHSIGKHSRASSEISVLRSNPSSPASASADQRDSVYRAQNSRSPRIDHPNAPVPVASLGAEMTDEQPTQSVQSMLRSPGIRIDASHNSSFLDTEESDGESLRFSTDIPILQRNDEVLLDQPAKVVGVTLDELVDRLLLAPMSRADYNFQDIFLCLYRKFASPSELLSAIITRLDKTWDDKESHFLERTATQFRYIEVIARWVSLYPGDFARPTSRRKLETLVHRLTNEPIFTSSARHIQDTLENEVQEDDDTSWAKCDSPAEDDAATLVGRGSESLLADSMRPLSLSDSRSSGQLASEAGSSGLMSSAGYAGAKGLGLSSGRRPSALVQFNSYDDYEREAGTMEPMATLPLNKFRYHIFMDMDSGDIADEITRIDWIMFSSIRIRDVVRHVSLSASEKDRCTSLKNINRWIAHFNHVARWVSNMILLRDKAKHRAQCLQKYMDIALRLRQLKNYNGLAAVLAGINGTAVHRLAQTRALVDADVQKRFARLVLLMSTQKSHFAYRLAWENSPLPRIPFMPLHRRDLVSAEEGSRTFVGPEADRINWKKFEVLGEVLLPLMKSQGTPYPDLRKHQAARDLILDCRMPMDEEEMYQRSLQVEPTGGGADIKRKFSWLPK